MYSIRNLVLRGQDPDSDWCEYEYDFYKDGRKINSWFMDVEGDVTLHDLRDAMEKMKRVDLSFHCLDCAVNTSEIDEYYMVHDHIWLYANPDDYGMLCISCLEERLGRMLRPSDFTDAPVNGDFGNKSARLKERLGYGIENEVEVS